MTWRYALSTFIELLGLVAVVLGVSLIYVPAAVIIGGLIIVLLGLAVDPPAGKASS